MATEIYNKVLGQAQFGLGAVVGIILLVPAIGAKICEKIIAKRQHAIIGEKSTPLIVKPLLWRDLISTFYVSIVASAIILQIAIVLVASFTQLWPYKIVPTLSHYQFDVQMASRLFGIAFLSPF